MKWIFCLLLVGGAIRACSQVDTCRWVYQTDTILCSFALVADTNDIVHYLHPDTLFRKSLRKQCAAGINPFSSQQAQYFLCPEGAPIRVIMFNRRYGGLQIVSD
jgi:hypothetical protein